MEYKNFLSRLMRSGSTLMRSISDKKPSSGPRGVTPPGNHPDRGVFDKDDFGVLEELQQLLPPEDTARFLLEEMSLAHEAHSLVRKFYTLSRLQRGSSHGWFVSKTASRRDMTRLTSSIDPQELKEQLFQKIEDEQLYLVEDLSLAALAHELEIEPYQLTRFLNHHLHTTFHDLINAYRVKAAQERLKTAPGETILDIAFAVGFNSKASFNRVFKRTTGTTPTQYRQMEKSQPHPTDSALKQDTR